MSDVKKAEAEKPADQQGSTYKKKPEVEEKSEELSEEDQKLKDDIEMLVERLSGSDDSLYDAALETLLSLIRASTTTMTSVPKPLKFMRPHFNTMKDIHLKISNPDTKTFCADVISALAMTSEGGRDCVKYRLLGRKGPIGDWGHEYVRHLASELMEEWKKMLDEEDAAQAQEDLMVLAKEILAHDMRHNAEAEACDLLMEMERLDLLPDFVEEADQQRVCLYLMSCVPYSPDPENLVLTRTAKDLYQKFGREIEAMRCAIVLNDVDEIRRVFLECKDPLVQRQMAILLGRHQIFLDIPDELPFAQDLGDLNSNSNLFQYFLSLARELDIMQPKTPEDIYKTHLEPTRPFGTTSAPVDSAKTNLASTFVNGFVNTGFCTDKLITGTEEANRWFFRNKDYGILSAAASQGLIFRWDVDGGLAQCDKFLYSQDDYVRAGTLLAIGIISSGIHHDCDPAQALLQDYLSNDKMVLRIGAVLGLGLAYANSKRSSVHEEIIPGLRDTLTDPKASNEVTGLVGLSLGLICVGTGNAQVAQDLVQVMMDKTEKDLKDASLRFLALGVALIYLGRQEESEVIIESLRALPPQFSAMATVLTEVCAYAGTGNVLKIQKLLHICSEHYEQKDDKKDDKDKQKKESKLDLSLQQAVAVLGIALIALGEDIGSSMSFRIFANLFRYGEPVIRRAVPLALGLISVSNTQLNILETLSKFSHDSDPDTAHNAIFALGLVGAGTNNARLAAMLRQLAVYHQRDAQSLMLVRIAQGLTHMGKGTMTMNPFHSDRQLLCPSALAGLIATCFAFLDGKNTILSGKHYLLYCLVPAIQPRLLITFLYDDTDEHDPMKQVNVSVRVGQAVDVVGQAGKPKTITGFQTHTTPVLLSFGERAELATEQYIAVTSCLEGLVILKKNPEYEDAKR